MTDAGPDARPAADVFDVPTALDATSAPDVSTADDVSTKDPPADRVRVVPTEWPRTPPPIPTYSRGSCPTLRGGPDALRSLNTGFPTGPHTRQFRLVVPPNYDPNGTDRWPLLFAWHWLAGSSEMMLREGEIPQSAEQARMIVVVPDQRTENGQPVNPFVWPFITPTMAEADLLFTDDLLACISAQYRVDPARVHALGVSAGALWLTHLLTTPRAQHFASVAVASGGIGIFRPAFEMTWATQPNRFPAIVLWGGERDRLGIDFNAASIRLRDALIDDGHFIVTCAHDRGHALPPITPPPGETRFGFVWQFFRDHPYGMAPATSPWTRAGLPPSAPSWCEIPAVLR